MRTNETKNDATPKRWDFTPEEYAAIVECVRECARREPSPNYMLLQLAERFERAAREVTF